MPSILTRRRGLAAAALALAMLTAPPLVSASGTPRTGPTERTPAGDAATRQPTSRTVTLVTGDKVTVNTAADGKVTRSVQGPDGRRTGFAVHEVGKDTYVYPNAAVPYLAAGQLDKELFNVTGLLADGYGDAQRSTLPLIVTYTDAAVRARAAAVPTGATRTRALNSIRGAALSQQRAKAGAFWSALTGGNASATGRGTATEPRLSSGIAKVWLDGKVKADLSDTTAQIGAPEAWAGGNTGQGVDVAVLDTGVDTRHPDLVGQVSESTSFVPDQDVEDRNGHGTHVASTIAGTGAASDGKERGVAPGARLHIGKVLDDNGNGQESWVLAGMEWAAREQHAKVISMSLGAGPTDGHDPLSQAVDELSAETGALFTIAAGNSGKYTVSTPSVADAALSVGAVDGSDRLADFSGTGPRQGDAGLKPELTAPGVDVLAARSQYTSEGTGSYQTMSGTSMATPHVAGAAALLARAHPDWSGKQLKDGLVSTTKTTPEYTPYEAGSGRLDAAAAVKGTVFASGSVFGGYRDASTPAGGTSGKTEKKVTYTNTGDRPVTLDLDVRAPGAATGAFTLSARQITLPPNGTGTVDLITDFDLVKADTVTSGQILATDGSGALVAHTITGAYKMGARYTITVNGKDRSGRPMGGAVWLTGERFALPLVLDDSGTGTVTLPGGTYAVELVADVEGVHGSHSKGLAVLTRPEVVLDKNVTVDLDASKARQVTVRTPQAATPALTRLDFYRYFDEEHAYRSEYVPDQSYDSSWVLPGKEVTKGTYEFGVAARLEQPALTIAAGKHTYDDLRVRRAHVPLKKGGHTYGAVFAGEGGTDAYRGLDAKGRTVVVRRNDSVALEEQADNAAKAGATVLLVVNDGDGRLAPWRDDAYLVTEIPAPLTVATLTADEGDDLIARIKRGRTTLRVTSNPTTEYVYDIAHHQSGVPADPSYRPRRADLNRVEVSFRNNHQARAMEIRVAVWHDDYMTVPLPTPAQGKRTDWVSAGTVWHEEAFVNRELQISNDTFKRYPRGTTSHLEYFGPIQRPRMNSHYMPLRSGNTVGATIPGWSDSEPGHAGTTFGNAEVQDRVKIYQGDTLIRASDTNTIGSPRFPLVLAPEKLRYRLVSDNARGNWTNDYSTTTSTEWGFTSQETAADTVEVLPLIQLDYAVTGMDASGRSGRRSDITVTPTHLAGAPGSDTIKTVSVDISYDDGSSWRHATLRHTERGWCTELNAPAKARFVTLRTSASDTQGNTVKQRITRAFGLK
ncbi:S8 family serine peptidase [Streptomyces siamensis]|uniref:S8 family serine peptidase n=1 Tax=Streptomyces siamensis TaxID=1274986 RepID=A0ABP9J649_9ACTN